MQTSRLRQCKLSTYLKCGIKHVGWLNVGMWTHSSIHLWKPTQFWDWVLIFYFFFPTHSDDPNTWQRAHSLFYCKGESTLYECREHVNDCLYHSAIMFTLHSLVDAPVWNHQHATPISLSLSHPLQTSHMLLALWRIIFCGINFNSPFTDKCQVSYKLSVFSVSKCCFKRVLMSICG